MIEKALLGVALAGLALATLPAGAADPKPGPALSFTMNDIDGKAVKLSKYQGKVVLMVNVASQCGLTPQYAKLQALHEKYADKGLVILGFPCNDFGKQEPGSEAEIKEFCTARYKVSFPMFSKIAVKGPEAAPLYKFLTSKETNPQFGGDIEWNFAKFLVNRKGEVTARIPARTDPNAPDVVALIEKELAAK